ncbi:LOW QUALITY PROTEIN: hypothetical protein PanWU01x14_068910 [Parasponia andersonii]|uniref:Uncharacterized protein n=1 Tax=Parasponia andersonii TaxID=3476 RepID=A0A2P5DFH8_PARAD|nr:LOW QUALITY PROTEIN: hypothetical protein PanWU01x14_068910 [Parasponia andersonii]
MVAKEHPRVLRTGKKETPMKLQIKSRPERFEPVRMREAPGVGKSHVGCEAVHDTCPWFANKYCHVYKIGGTHICRIIYDENFLVVLGLGSAQKGLGSLGSVSGPQKQFQSHGLYYFGPVMSFRAQLPNN